MIKIKTKEEVYRDYVTILYSDLVDAINQYCKTGYSINDTKYVNTYLFAFLGAVVSYYDTLIKPTINSTKCGESEIIKACKFANNTVKHCVSLISHIQTTGGVALPIHLPMIIKPIDIIWKKPNFESKHQDQKEAYVKLFEGKSILKTLGSILNELKIDIEK